MKAARILQRRRGQWRELESLCDAMQLRGSLRRRRPDATPSAAVEADPHLIQPRVPVESGATPADAALRFASLYRGVCADLALAESYQLPPATVTYLHRLVARAHNQLYRAGGVSAGGWLSAILRDAPRQIYADGCVRLAAVVFFGLFSLSMYLGYQQTLFPQFAATVVGPEQLDAVEAMYEVKIDGSLDHYVTMAGFYIMHNTGIGLRCFAYGILLLPCLFVLSFNAVSLGTIFGYMARPEVDGADNFFHFVTAHGPFELTAIALSAGAGLRMGIGLFQTAGRGRVESLRRSATAAVPIMAASAMLFFLAALTEGFISPSPLPYLVKAAWAVASSSAISFYFVILGQPPGSSVR